MRIVYATIVLSLLALAPGAALSANDYSLEYSSIDLSGGRLSGEANPVEDLITGELQGLCESSSTTYTMSSILRWPAPVSAASNWTIYQ